jgi:hypothetical protein
VLTAEQVRDLLRKHGTVRPQSASEWRGEIPLPPAVERFYGEVGPVDITIKGQGNPYFLPKLADLWQFQMGYRWHGFTGERLPEWDDDWVVVADEGGDAFILSRTNDSILFALHGRRLWEPEPIYPDIFTMAGCMAILGSIVAEARDDFTDQECRIRPKYQTEAIRRLGEVLESRTEAEAVLGMCGWVDPTASDE